MLSIDLTGKRAFVAGVADDGGFGFAIAKSLAEAGATVCIGCWPPTMKILSMMLERGKMDASRKMSDGELLQFEDIVAFDADYDTKADIPEDVATSKRYRDYPDPSIEGAATYFAGKFGDQPFDIVVHSLANGPEVKNPLLETSRHGYLSAIGTSAYSFVSMVRRFGPLVKKGGSFMALSYMASVRVVPGYGGGMSSAKAALESDTRLLAFEAGRKWGHRVNVISAGPYASRAASAIGFIKDMIEYVGDNSPLPESLSADEVGATAAFLSSSLATGITGTTVYVDKGFHVMGMAASATEVGDE